MPCLAPALVAILCFAPPSSASGSLNRKDQQLLESVTTAWFRGDAMGAVQLLQPLTTRITAERLRLFDEAFAGRKMPSLARMLCDARLALVDQGMRQKLPKLKEALLVLPALVEHVGELRAPDTRQTAIPDPPTADSIEKYEELLWTVHVQRNRLDSARRVATFAADLAKSVPKSHLAKLESAEREVIERDYQTLLAEVERALSDLAELEIDIRLRRLELAERVLSRADLTPERFFAAYTWRLDANRIAEYLAPSPKAGQRSGDQPPPTRRREVLNEPTLAEETATRAKNCATLAGPLTDKATWLFEGLHWWLRGRYGAGPDFWGLAKSQAALASPQTMFPLFMSVARPQPTAPSSPGAASPYYDRRHHYWWAWEDRRIDTSVVSNTSSSSSHRDWCQRGYFW